MTRRFPSPSNGATNPSASLGTCSKSRSRKSRRARSSTSSPSPGCHSPRMSTTSPSRTRRSTRRSSVIAPPAPFSPSSARPCPWSRRASRSIAWSCGSRLRDCARRRIAHAVRRAFVRGAPRTKALHRRPGLQHRSIDRKMLDGSAAPQSFAAASPFDPFGQHVRERPASP